MNLNPITITLEALESTQVRNAIGERIFTDILDAPDEDGGVLGFVRGILGGLGRLVGFVWRGVAWLLSRFSFSDLWDTIVEGAYTLAYFDWNQSDDSIKSQIEANNAALAQLIGRFAGSGTIRVVSIGVAAGLAVKFPVVAGRVAVELAKDTTGALRGEFISMLAGFRQIAVENGLLQLVLAFRSRRMFGLEPIAEDKPYWSFAEAIEERVSQIDNVLVRNFVMGYLEGAEDAIIDVGYVVAQTLDDFVAGQRYAQVEPFGPDRAVKVTLDTRTDEQIVLAGPQALVKQSVDLAIANHQVIWNRDVGQIVGMPVESFPRARHMVRQLLVTFKDVRQPPFTRADGTRAKEVSYTIPDAKRGLTWAEIKAAARAFTWGPWRATANLDNNRQMAVYGSSPSEAESQLRSLLTLSTADIVTLSVSEERITNPALVKRPTLVYPAYANLTTAPTDFQGQPIQGPGAFRRERRRIILWSDSEPDDLGPLG